MTKYLFALSGCHDAFVATPLLQAILARGGACHVAWFGARDDYDAALSLGLPQTDATIAGTDDGDALLAAHEFAADDWYGSEIVLTVGGDEFAVAIAQAMERRGRLVVRLGAGVRGEPERDRMRMLADHAAMRLCVADEAARQRLVGEGRAPDDVAVVGSLTAEALATLPTSSDEPRSLLVAIEHEWPKAHTSLLPDFVARLEQAARSASLPLRLVPTVMRPMLERGGVHHDPDGFTPADGPGQLRCARAAAVIVTDSLGWQETSAAFGVPCVVHRTPGAGWRDDLVASGHVTLATNGIDAAVRDALQRARPRPLDGVGVADRVLAAIERWLAPDGPPPAGPLPSDADASGRTFDGAEIANVTAVLRAGTLNSTRGTYVHRFERDFADWLGCRHAIACASGSAAVHAALAALGLSAGDEVVTTPITDMGALTPILYEGAVPVFADVDADTLNVTAATIAAQLTERTRAIVVTHLFGRPCELDDIVALAERRGLPVIEDAAQAFGATWRQRRLGTFGALAAFSLQQGKHITTGEGGIVCTDDDELARKVFLFVNKAWGYGDAHPDHYFPALNYRMTELQGAVACGQLPKLACVVEQRRRVADALRAGLAELPGLRCPTDPEHGEHSYWKFAFGVDADVVPGGAVALGSRMREQGIACVPRYVQKPAFECQLFRDWRRHPVSALPLGANARGATDGPLFDRRDYPGAIRGLEQVVVLPINERYRPEHVEMVVGAIAAAHRELLA